MKLGKGFVLGVGLTFGAVVWCSAVAGQQFFNQQNVAPKPPKVTVAPSLKMIEQKPPGSVLEQVGYSKTIANRSNILSLKNGSLTGRILWLDHQLQSNTPTHANLWIYFIRGNKIAHQTQTDKDGKFSIANIAPGMYSFVAIGSAGFTTYGLAVTDNENEATNVMEAAAVSTTTPGLEEILKQRLPSQVVDAILNRHGSVQASSRNGWSGGSKVRLINGELTGTIFDFDEWGHQQPVEGTIVNLIKNGHPFMDVKVEKDGNYRINKLEPGIYDFIAVSQRGLAAVRFEATQQDSSMTAVAFKRTKLVPTSLDIVLTNAQDTSSISRFTNPSVIQSADRFQQFNQASPATVSGTRNWQPQGQPIGQTATEGAHVSSFDQFPHQRAVSFRGSASQNWRIGGGRRFGR